MLMLERLSPLNSDLGTAIRAEDATESESWPCTLQHQVHHDQYVTAREPAPWFRLDYATFSTLDIRLVNESIWQR